jgi:hypothetical protein
MFDRRRRRRSRGAEEIGRLQGYLGGLSIFLLVQENDHALVASGQHDPILPDFLVTPTNK